jgi:uncharacterized protein YndB with AHSA1/START domain
MNTGDTDLEIRHLCNAPPTRVFDAWLNREEWQSWIGPVGLRCQVPLLEPRVGGRFRIIMRLTDGRVIPVAGIYQTVDAPRILAFTWGAESDSTHHTLITLSLAEKGAKTELRLRQEGFASIQSRDMHVTGWSDALNKLDSYLAARQVGATRASKSE